MFARLRKWLRGAANEENHAGGPETRRNGDHRGGDDARGGAADSLSVEGDEPGRGDDDGVREYVEARLGDAFDDLFESRVGELRSAITAELDSFRERLDREERRGRELTDEWQEALARFARIGARLAAQARRDLKKSTDELESLPLGGEDPSQMGLPGFQVNPLPPAAPQEMSREQRKAQLRRSIRG